MFSFFIAIKLDYESYSLLLYNYKLNKIKIYINEKTILLGFILTTFLGYSQSFLLDFSDSADAEWSPFNGTTVSIVSDPDDVNNDVLQITGGTNPWDGGSISFTTYLDLSNDSDNTITFSINVPAGSSNSHLLKFEGNTVPGAPGSTELLFSTSGTGWQNISIDFGFGLGEYAKMSIFTDADYTETITTSGVYLFDDFDGAINGDTPPPDAIPSETSPIPKTPNNEVLSIYGDTAGFTNIWESDYNFGTLDGLKDLDATAGVDEVIKMDFSIAGWGQGLDLNKSALTDLSSYDYLHFDYWADTDATQFRFILIESDGSVN